MESKLRLEASLEGQMESKLTLEANLRGPGGPERRPSGVQIALGGQLYVSLSLLTRSASSRPEAPASNIRVDIH